MEHGRDEHRERRSYVSSVITVLALIAVRIALGAAIGSVASIDRRVVIDTIRAHAGTCCNHRSARCVEPALERNRMKKLLFVVLLGAAGCGGSSKPADTAPTSSPTAATADIVDTAVAAGSFKTLAAALTAAGLIETLKGPGPFTVFAPTDEAFAKLPAGTVEALLADKAKLTAVLTYHVVAGKVSSGEVVKLTEAATVQGGMLKIDASSGVKINGATVVKADIEASNGIIHVIDTVLLPPQ